MEKNNETLLCIILKISELFVKKARINLNYIATNWDSGYSSLYYSQFDIIYVYFVKNELSGLAIFEICLKQKYHNQKKVF